MECHTGNAHDESAVKVLIEVEGELDRLITDVKYGFPGLCVFPAKKPVKTKFCQDGKHEAWLAFVTRIEDQINATRVELGRKVESTAGG